MLGLNDWGRVLVSIIVVTGFLIIVVLVLTTKLQGNATSEVLLVLLGALVSRVRPGRLVLGRLVLRVGTEGRRDSKSGEQVMIAVLAALPAILGALAGMVPAIIGLFTLKANNAQQLAMRQLDMQAAKEGGALQIDLAAAQADIRQADHIYDFGGGASGNRWVDALAVFIRPFLTLAFFHLVRDGGVPVHLRGEHRLRPRPTRQAAVAGRNASHVRRHHRILVRRSHDASRPGAHGGNARGCGRKSTTWNWMPSRASSPSQSSTTSERNTARISAGRTTSSIDY
jgi:hypothetical protein